MSKYLELQPIAAPIVEFTTQDLQHAVPHNDPLVVMMKIKAYQIQ